MARSACLPGILRARARIEVMNTKALLGVTAVVELTAAAALFAVPSRAAALLLGTGLDSRAAIVVARIAGAALLSIGLTCWLVRNSPEGGSQRGRIAGLLAYNAAVAVLLVFAAVAEHLRGIALGERRAARRAVDSVCRVLAAPPTRPERRQRRCRIRRFLTRSSVEVTSASLISRGMATEAQIRDGSSRPRGCCSPPRPWALPGARIRLRSGVARRPEPWREPAWLSSNRRGRCRSSTGIC